MQSPFAISADENSARTIYKRFRERFFYLDAIRSVQVKRPSGASRVIHVKSVADKNAVMQSFARNEFLFPRGSEQDKFLNSRSSGDILIVDAGANIGATATMFAMDYPNSTIVAIEPEPGNYNMLEKNTRGLHNVILERAALCDISGQLVSLNLPSGHGNDGFRVSKSTETDYSVKTLDIGSILEKYPEKRPFLLKIDIEGSESEVFAASQRAYINRFDAIFVELHDWMLPRQRSAKAFLEFAASTDRDFILCGDKVASLKME